MRTVIFCIRGVRAAVYATLLISCLVSSSLAAEVAVPPWAVVQRGADFNVLQYTDESGKVRRVTELATGLNYRTENGDWQPVVEGFELFAGGARTKSARHSLVCSASLNQPSSIRVSFEGGANFAVTPSALLFEDVANGNTVFLGTIQDSAGEYHAPNTIVYPNAFDGIQADVQYVNSRDGLEQFVVLREAPPHPNQWGGQLNPETTVLQCWTEVFERPGESRIENRVLPDGQADQAVSFPQFQIGAGRAFPIGAEVSGDLGAPVAKRWYAVEGRLFLIESVLYSQVQKALATLPAMNQAAIPGLRKKGAIPPRVQQVKVDRKERMQLAAVVRKAPGLAAR